MDAEVEEKLMDCCNNTICTY